MTLLPKDVGMNALDKINSYIERRIKKDREMEEKANDLYDFSVEEYF